VVEEFGTFVCGIRHFLLLANAYGCHIVLWYLTHGLLWHISASLFLEICGCQRFFIGFYRIIPQEESSHFAFLSPDKKQNALGYGPVNNLDCVFPVQILM